MKIEKTHSETDDKWFGLLISEKVKKTKLTGG